VAEVLLLVLVLADDKGAAEVVAPPGFGTTALVCAVNRHCCALTSPGMKKHNKIKLRGRGSIWQTGKGGGGAVGRRNAQPPRLLL
jgi:hypothetical protein